MIASGMIVLVPPELETGFRLAGVETVGAENGDEASRALEELIAGGERALIAIYEPFLSTLPDQQRRVAESSLAPVVVALPAGLERHDADRHRGRISEMLSRAVGYHITFGQERER
jgi:vacuolar-type H+-ATPase subunit F/Vma7